MPDAPDLTAEPPDAEALARAGWTDADLTWEQIQVAAAEAQAEGDPTTAAEFWTAGLDLAREAFAENDPRLAASLANVGGAHRQSGDAETAAALIDEALSVWGRGEPWIEALKPERRARSSLFHLRLESKHPGGYDRHSQARYRELAAEGRARTEALKGGCGRPKVDIDRWRRERPAGYTDTRKLLAAVLLLAAAGDGHRNA